MVTSTAEWVRWYIDGGFYPVPVPAREKGPTIRGWQQLRIQNADIPEYFNGRPTNVGILLGIEGLADIDLDCLEALHAADEFLPRTGFVFVRKSRPRSHRFYLLDKPVAMKKYPDPLVKDRGKNTLLELRCTKRDGEVGLQTIVPPSVHPSGPSSASTPKAAKHLPRGVMPSIRARRRVSTTLQIITFTPRQNSRRVICQELSGANASKLCEYQKVQEQQECQPTEHASHDV